MREAGFGDNQSALSRASGVPQPTINRILKGGGKRGPETETVKKLAAACRVNFVWLMEGKGHKHLLPNDRIEAEVREIREPALVEYAGDDRRKADRRAEQPLRSYLIDPKKFRGVPVIGKGTGGITDRDRDDGGYPTGESDKYGEVGTSDQNAFLTEIDEMSMYPKYTPGDYALVEPNTPIDIEDDVLVKFTDYGPILKRLLSRKGGFVRLGSYNTQDVITRSELDVLWMYYIAYPVPAKKIKTRF